MCEARSCEMKNRFDSCIDGFSIRGIGYASSLAHGDSTGRRLAPSMKPFGNDSPLAGRPPIGNACWNPREDAERLELGAAV